MIPSLSQHPQPDRTIPSSGQGPPGKSMFNVKLVPLTETESEEHAEVLDSLPLGAICFGDSESLTSTRPWSLDEWRSHYPYWNEENILPREHIGDCYAMVASCILTLEPPFLGDSLYCVPDLHLELWFHIHWDEDMHDFILSNRLTESWLRVTWCLMENPDFDISYWFAEKWSHELGLTDEITHHHCMGEAISIVATKLLIDGIVSSYPSIER